MNPRIAGRHITHAAFRLFGMSDAFGGQPERRADALAVGPCTDEQNFEPTIGVAAIVAEEFGKIAAIVDGDVDVAIIVEIGGGQPAASDGTSEVRTQRVRNLFKLALSQIPEHQQRYLV